MRCLMGLSLFVVAATSGCMAQLERNCPDCTVVDYKRVEVPPPRLGTSTEVVLVHGALGFGSEWSPVVSELQKSPGLSYFAWTWPGALGSFSTAGRALTAELQALVDRLPVSVDEIVVLADSAAGALTNYAARRLRVPAGRRVTVALLDPALWPKAGKRDSYTPLPERVDMKVYLAQDPPAPGSKPPAPDPSAATDVPREYVGKVGHDPLVAKVALPLLTSRRL
jgi:hypothetical protein